MPWKSNQQRKWGNSVGVKVLGKQVIHEFNESSKGAKLPQVASGMQTAVESLHNAQIVGKTKHGHQVHQWHKGKMDMGKTKHGHQVTRWAKGS